MEPERNIEKELKAFAEQRRTAAGSPPELDAATRIRLHDEVARSAKTSVPATRTFWQGLMACWPRIAIAGSAVAAGALITWWSLPSSKLKQTTNEMLAMQLSTQESKESSAASKDKFEGFAEQIPPAVSPPAPVAAPTAAPAKRMAAAKTKSVSDDVIIGLNEPVGAAAPPVSVTAPAPNVTFSTGTFSGGANSRIDVNGQHSRLLDAEKTSPPASDFAGAPFSSATYNSDGLSGHDSAKLVKQPFRRIDLPVQKGKALKIVGTSNLLESFRVEQSLERLRVIDSDGSVYAGFVMQVSEEAKPANDLFKKLDVTKAEQPATADRKQSQPMRAYRFRVSGTNRTLNENVLFTGDFLTRITGALTVTNSVPTSISGGAAPAGAGESFPLELQKARMEGRLLLGGTNNIEIRAAPVKP